MPLRDHGREPLSARLPYSSLLHAFACAIADELCVVLPEPLLAAEFIHGKNKPFIDIEESPPDSGPVADAAPFLSWQAPMPDRTFPGNLPEQFEVAVYTRESPWQITAAVFLVGPNNKHEPQGGQAFATKVAACLHDGIAVTILDVVTTATTNLHNEICRLMHIGEDACLKFDPPLYAASYRPVIRESRSELDLWTASFGVGDRLPTMPLRVMAHLMVPIDFEAIYVLKLSTFSETGLGA
jgi:hypothetical protein